MGTATKPDGPIASVCGRTNNSVVSTEQMKRLGHQLFGDARDITADNEHRSTWQSGGDASQALPQIALALRHDIRLARPRPGTVRSDREPCSPSPVAAQSSQCVRKTHSLKA